MGKSAKATTEPASNAAAMSAAMHAVNPVVANAWLNVMTGSAEFVMKRLRHDLETQQALLNCKSPTELLQIQSDFYQTAMQQYSEEAVHLFKMMSDATEEAVKGSKSATARGYDDVPL